MYLGQRKLKELLGHSKFKIFNINQLMKDCVIQCLAFRTVNPWKKESIQIKKEKGFSPGVHWEADFTEVRPGKYGYK